MAVKLIIFDLDGTIADSSIDITNALNYAIKPYDLKPLTVNDTIKMVGEGITRLIEKLIESSRLNTVLAQAGADIKKKITDRFLKHYTGHITDYTKEYPGVRETLESLTGYKKAVISNKRESLSIMTLDGLGLSGFFDLIIGSDTTPEKKPSPVPVQRALSEFNIQPVEAMMVGDSNFDIDAGKAAGVITVAVTYGYRPIEVIRHADYMIDRMTDLIPLLGKLSR